MTKEEARLAEIAKQLRQTKHERNSLKHEEQKQPKNKKKVEIEAMDLPSEGKMDTIDIVCSPLNMSS